MPIIQSLLADTACLAASPLRARRVDRWDVHRMPRQLFAASSSVVAYVAVAGQRPTGPREKPIAYCGESMAPPAFARGCRGRHESRRRGLTQATSQ